MDTEHDDTMSLLGRAEIRATPFGRLLFRELVRQKRTPLQLVKALGYKNLGKGLRDLEHAARSGEIAPKIIKRLVEGLNITDERARRVVEQTELLLDKNKARETLAGLLSKCHSKGG